jgi:uncharacterized protein YyaL (SSP411 family)
MSIHWRAWNRDAFDDARSSGRPVLLSITASWCAASAEMHRTSYGDARVAAIVSDRFVAVRVDADRRPDIAERYGLGGLPTTAFLTADGGVVGGGTFVDADRLADVLERVVHAFASRAGELGRGSSPDGGDPPRTAAPPTVDDLSRQVHDAYDDEFGGFGTEPKFPLAAPLDYLLVEHAAGGGDAHRVRLERSLDAMGWGGLYDIVDGGFFRGTARRDWQQPFCEKLLDVNAALLAVYAAAAGGLHAQRYGERVEGVLRYVQSWLADQAEGGWFASQASSASYYDAATPDERRTRPAPPVDTTFYSTGNAAMASAARRAAGLLDDPSLATFALQSLERVVLATYVPGEGVAHAFDGAADVRGLLEDQVAMGHAHLDAFETTADVPYRMMAEELAHYAIRTMWDPQGGGFFDRAPVEEGEAVGRLRERLKPFVANCEAARLLRRLASATKDEAWAARADATLESVAPFARAEGPLAAYYLLALGPARLR